ncbi:hypothetical protein [Streptomyces sp. NBC_00557]|uniref:hypothetical protein n=1 Tax=Streptomyces sp. NBC_00557 TaxID=2975776 RepID=UPI002E804957|nr:hypothetical protein [Streptomyces sp. NBC_00557]WUC36378.1 hypothetical protein OG956_20215 [Streptomyces sp. NBC_00557]
MSAPTTRQWLRAAAGRISTGSGRLTAHYAGWTVRAITSRVTSWPWWVQLGLALLVLYRGPQVLARLGDRIHERVASGAWGGLLFTLAGLWIVAAYRAGRDGWEPSQRTAKAEPTEEEPADAADEEDQDEPALEQAPAGPPPVSPVALIAAVRDIGTPHAQLKPLAEHLGVSTDAVRAAAAAMGWQVKDVRMQGRSASAGLRWDEAPSLPPGGPSPSVVGAGQRADDNDDDTFGEGPEEEVRVMRTDGGLIIYDLADTHRRRGTVSR